MKQTRGIRNNNPVNIRQGSHWVGLTHPQTDSEFCTFESMAYGIRAALVLLRNYLSGWGGRRAKLNTIYKIINNWAPSNENNTEAYINFVSEKSGINKYQVLWFSDNESIFKVLAAMCLMESSYVLERDLFDAARCLM